MGRQYVIDCGSRSIKLHEASRDTVSLHATRSWDPINDTANVARVGQLLADLTKDLPAVSSIHVVGTAAARRDPNVASAIGEACATLGWTYETLTHDGEAMLIRAAFAGREESDIVNAGGGSIQIVHPDGSADLLGFGMSDLNAQYNLAGWAGGRRIEEACAYVRAELPSLRRPFIYSGGELSYLRAMGAAVGGDGRCSVSEFVRIATMVDAMELDALEAFSPFDEGWMRGAVASNVIVKAMLLESGLDHYFASDINIADGIIAALAGRAAHAADARL